MNKYLYQQQQNIHTESYSCIHEHTLTLVYDIIITRDIQRLSSKSHVIVFYYYYYFYLHFVNMPVPLPAWLADGLIALLCQLLGSLFGLVCMCDCVVCVHIYLPPNTELSTIKKIKILLPHYLLLYPDFYIITSLLLNK